MTARTTSRHVPLPKGVVVSAVLLAGALDFAANWLAAHYLLAIGPFLLPSGTFVFTLSFAVYDYLRRWHGLRPTLAAIALGFAGVHRL